MFCSSCKLDLRRIDIKIIDFGNKRAEIRRQNKEIVYALKQLSCRDEP